MKTKDKIREMLMLIHISAVASTIVLNKKILEWLKNLNIIFVWQLYTDKFNIEDLKRDIEPKEVSEFRRTIEPLFGNLEIKLSDKEAKELEIKSLSEGFRFDLATMCLSITDIKPKISKKLFTILTDAADFTHLWMLYENRHTETSRKPFKETFLLWYGTSTKLLNELESFLADLDLPELDTIKFTDEEICILEEICN